jgi:FG-GAP-like repeat/FG-GAP repeat
MAINPRKARIGGACAQLGRAAKAGAAAWLLGCAASGHAAALLVVGSDADPAMAAEVSAYDGPSLDVLLDGNPYLASTAGVRVASADIDADGFPDVVTVPGASLAATVLEYGGRNGEYLGGFAALDPAFTGGAYVAAGDVDGDGHADILVGAGLGGGPIVKVFSGADKTLLAGFFAYGPGFSAGVRVAAGDVNGDGRADIIVAPGPGVVQDVRVFDGASLVKIADFFPFPAGFSGGAFVASADLDGDGHADIVVSADAGDAPIVAAFDGISQATMAKFLAYAPGFTGGVRVAAGDLDGDGRPEIVTATGSGAVAEVKAFAWPGLAVVRDFFPFSRFYGGAFVALSPADDVIFASRFDD